MVNKKPLMYIDPVNLSRIICPGCGRKSSPRKTKGYFSCPECKWECQGDLPTLEQVMTSKNPDLINCKDVDLIEYLRAIFE